MNAFANLVSETIQTAKRRWALYLTLGILLILVGILALLDSFAATVASIVVFGVIILVAGVLQVIASFQARGAGHIVLLLLLGILDIVIGWMLIQHPGIGMLAATMLLAVWFVFTGIFRFVGASLYRFPQYGWAMVSGVITFILGVLLWAHWPVSALWFIGFAVGLNFIFSGISWTTFALRLKKI